MLQALQEICGLPWFRLPEEVLDQLLERFFIEHHNLALPYHETRQFKWVFFFLIPVFLYYRNKNNKCLLSPMLYKIYSSQKNTCYSYKTTIEYRRRK